jgi:hypothetical protein
MSKFSVLSILRAFALLWVLAFGAAPGAWAQYCASNATSTADSKIDSVRLVGNSVTLSNNTIAGCATYSNFTALPAPDLSPGGNYNIIVRLGTCGGNFNKYARVFIDYNQDFDFLDPGETLGTIGPILAPAIGTVNFTVPGGASLGNTRLRIVCIEGNANPPSCGTYTWGETEDYTVSIMSPSPINGGASALGLPASACGLSATQPISFTINNVGTNPIGPFQVGYSINGGAPVFENFTGTLAPSTNQVFTFATTANMSTPGLYNVKAWVTVPGDGFALNDTISGSVTNIPVINTFPNFQDFESGQGGWVAGGTASSWQFGTPNFGGLTAAASGVNAWVTNLTNFYNNNEQSFVVSPCIDFSAPGLPHIQASIYWNSETFWDGAQLQASTNGGSTWFTIGQFNDPIQPTPTNWYNAANFNGLFGFAGATNQNGWGGSATASSGTWVTMSRVLPELAGQANVRLRFAFGSDGSVQVGTGFAFDNVRLNLLPPFDDVDITATNVPLGGCNLNLASVGMTLANTGVQTFPAGMQIPVAYNLNGGPPTLDTITLANPVNPGGTFTFTFSTMADFSQVGDYNILMWADLPSDTIPGNDTMAAFVSHKPLVNTFPYFESFENGTGGWESGGSANRTWVLGTPAKPAGSIQGAYHGTKAWVNGGLTGFYNNNDQSFVEGPCFDLSTVPANYQVALSYWRDTEQGWDGANLQYSLNGGATWNLLGTTGTGTNWYNGTINAGTPGGFTQAWNGQGSGYVRAYHPLPPALIGAFDVRFRVGFGSDGSVTDYGFAFDAIAIGAPTPFSLGPDTTVCGEYAINTGLPSGGLSKFTWSTSPNDTTNSIFLVNNGVAAQTYTVILAYMNPEGFLSRDTAIITILPGPDPVYFGDTISFCQGTTVELQADTSLLGNTVFTYNWSTGSTSFNTFVSSTQMVTYTAFFPGGCSVNDTVYLIRNDSLNINLGPDQVLCGASSTTLNATQSGDNLYAWNNGANTPIIPVTFTGTYVVQVSNACFLQSDTIHITLVPNAPDVTLGPDQNVCAGTSVTLTAAGLIPPGSGILWSTGATTNTINVTAPGTYTVQVTDAFGCSAQDDVVITHTQAPIAGLNINPASCPTFGFTNTSSGSTSILWSFGDGATSTQPTLSHTYLSNGQYTVSLTAINACGTNTVSQVVNVNCITGVGDPALVSQITLYPNPSDGLFALSFGDLVGTARIAISNLAGQVVATHTLESVAGGQPHSVDLRHLAQGVYSLTVATAQGNATFRLVIQR